MTSEQQLVRMPLKVSKNVLFFKDISSVFSKVYEKLNRIPWSVSHFQFLDIGEVASSLDAAWIDNVLH